MEGSSFDPGKTAVNFSQDPTSGGGNDNSVGISQSFAWPGLYKNQKRFYQAQTTLIQKSIEYTKAEVLRDTRVAYYNYLFAVNALQVFKLQDSIYTNYIKKAELRYKVGETSNLELMTARNKYQEVQAQKRAAEADVQIESLNLQQLLNISSDFIVSGQELPQLIPNLTNDSVAGGFVEISKQQIALAEAKIALEHSKAMPDFSVGYAQQLVIRSFDPANLNRGYTPGTRIAGIQVGVGIPLFAGAGRARVKGEKLALQIAEADYLKAQNQLAKQYKQEVLTYHKHKQIVDYYTTEGNRQADDQIRIAQVSYDLGEIGYMEYIQNMALAVQSKLIYLQEIKKMNESVIQLQFLKGH